MFNETWVIPDFEQAFGTSSLHHNLCKGTFIQTEVKKNTYLQSAAMWRGWEAFMNSFSIFILGLWSLCRLGMTFTVHLEDGSFSEEKFCLVTSGCFEVLTLQIGWGRDESWWIRPWDVESDSDLGTLLPISGKTSWKEEESNVCISLYKCVFLLLFAWAIGGIFLNWTENHSSAFFCVVRLANCAVIKQNYPLIG